MNRTDHQNQVHYHTESETSDTSIIHLLYKDNQFWKLIHCSAAARKKKDQLTWFHKAMCKIQEKKIVSESLVILNITTP